MNWLDPPPGESLCRLLRRLLAAILAVCLLYSIRAEQAPSSNGPIEQMWAEATAAQQTPGIRPRGRFVSKDPCHTA